MIVEQLKEIASNLWWAWRPEVWQIFRELDPELWRETNHNPVAFLETLDPELVEARSRERALASRINAAVRRLREYTSTHEAGLNMECGPLRRSPVAYFCAEFGIHEALPIYSGGLGVLAGDHMKASSDLGIPLIGIGLLYARGYFRQGIDDDGWQQESYGWTELDNLPLEKIIGDDGKPLTVQVEASDATIRAHVWEAKVGRNRLLLLDSDVEGNTDADRELTHVLYYGDRRVRIRQELLLGVGGARALEALKIRPGVFHLNEGHSAFAPLELCHQYMRDEGISFDEAKLRVARKTVFTTHTPVPAGHDRFVPELLEETTAPLREKLGLDHYTFHALGRVNPNDAGEAFCMTVLALKMSNFRNGVSNLHGVVSRDMWHSLWPAFERQHVPIGHVTNGVHTSTFLAPQMRALYDKYLETDWESRMDRPEAWAGMRDVDRGEFWETHQIMKSNLIDFVNHRVASQTAPKGSGKGEIVPGSGLRTDILTIGFARRFATYKRATLLLSEIERLKSMIADEDRPIQIIMAGKAHPADDGGKQLIQSIIKLTTDPGFKGRIVFLADYDLNIGRHLVQGVDVWLNNPRRPQEACGTSGQKVVLNGALNCSVLDGWWAEGYDGHNGFAIGDGQQFATFEAQDEFDQGELYRVLEEEVIPLYYGHTNGLPREWVERVIWAITSMGWQFNANRMVLDYLRNAYLPAVGATWVS